MRLIFLLVSFILAQVGKARGSGESGDSKNRRFTQGVRRVDPGQRRVAGLFLGLGFGNQEESRSRREHDDERLNDVVEPIDVIGVRKEDRCGVS